MLNSIWGWILPIGFVGTIIVVVLFILRFALRRIKSTTQSEGYEIQALVAEVTPPSPAADDGSGVYILQLEVFPPDEDDKITLKRVPYRVDAENLGEVPLLKSCALVSVKINPRQNNELYVRKGTVSWNGETDLNRARVALGGEAEREIS
jgi:hypothetical protein